MYIRNKCEFINRMTPLQAVGHTKDDFIMCEECLLLIVHCRKTASSSLGSGGLQGFLLMSGILYHMSNKVKFELENLVQTLPFIKGPLINLF